MAAGVGTLGVDGIGNHLDEGLKQLFLVLNELAGLQSHFRITRKGLAEGDLVGIRLALKPEHQHS